MFWGDSSLFALVSSGCVNVCRPDVKNQKLRHSALVGHWVVMYLQLVQTNTHECLVMTPHASEQAQSSSLLCQHFHVCPLWALNVTFASLACFSSYRYNIVALQVGLSAAGVCLTVNQMVSDILCIFPRSTPGWIFRVHGFLFRSDVIELLQRKRSLVTCFPPLNDLSDVFQCIWNRDLTV